RYEWRGTVTWTPAGTADTIRREAHWMTTVHTVATRAARQVAIVDGLPQAMLLARGTDEPRFAVVASDSAHVWVRECASRAAADSTAAAWLQGATLLDDVLLLRLPATIGDRWPDQAMKVADGFFEWTVTAATAGDRRSGDRHRPLLAPALRPHAAHRARAGARHSAPYPRCRDRRTCGCRIAGTGHRPPGAMIRAAERPSRRSARCRAAG
ncbi:MAG: hypothetical protein MUF21_14500, partial [Gemmatimonadaceae bacterium]|nr:hypothetical protein [Gemmatimonadaceae bacterium]